MWVLKGSLFGVLAFTVFNHLLLHPAILHQEERGD
jgi:hypothetical protein